jgi:hypothetical protein
MISFSESVISDRLQALTRALDADATLPGYLVMYDGTRPPNGAGHSSSAVGKLVFEKPSLDNVLQNTLTIRNPAQTLALSTGAPTWGRMFNGAGQFVADASVGVGEEDIVITDSTGAPAPTTQMYTGGLLSAALIRLTEL